MWLERVVTDIAGLVLLCEEPNVQNMVQGVVPTPT